MFKIIRRIERDVGVPNLSKIMADRINPTDLQSLLLEVYKIRTKRRNPRSILSDYVSNGFTLPSRCHPLLLLKWDRIAFSHLPKIFTVVELSPVSPLGSVSAIAPISQDWVLTTIRNTEVVSDPTNVLALECSLRRRKLTQNEPTDATPVRLACSHRAIRAQRYRGASEQQHFRLFSLCSAGRNTKNLRFNIEAIAEHIQFYLEALRDFLGPSIPLRVTIIDLHRDSHDEAILSLLENLKKNISELTISLEKAPAKRTRYYRELRFKVFATSKRGQEMELVDGGDTNWTQKLLNNAKERLVISGIGSERLCTNFEPVS